MSVERLSHDGASGDTVVIDQNNEKLPVDAPIPAPEAADAPETDELAQSTAKGNTQENAAEGAPLDRTPSQAAKMGKKKIAVVMAALCVRIRFVASETNRANLSVSHSSWCCFWPPWIWYAFFLYPILSSEVSFANPTVFTDDCFDGPPDHRILLQRLGKRLLMDRLVVSAG